MIIIAAIGLNSFDENNLRKIILAGADILRYNFSYRTAEQNINYIKLAQDTIDDLNADVKIMIDFPINKIRLGDFDIKQFAVRENEEFIFQSATYSPDCNQFLPVNTANLGEKVKLHETITIGDGEVAICVTETIDKQKIKAKILNNGVISYVKSFNIKNWEEKENIIANYTTILEKMETIKPDILAVSYVDKKINTQILQLIKQYQLHIKLIIKIEKQITAEELKNICQDNDYYAILIDRGELGVNLPFEKLGTIQKNIVDAAKEYKKPVFISTQILESTVNNLTPNRSEILDLTNIVLDGANGIMLCHETAVGRRPAYSITVAKKIITEAKKYKNKTS